MVSRTYFARLALVALALLFAGQSFAQDELRLSDAWTTETTLSLGPELRFFEGSTQFDAKERRDTVALRQEFDKPLSLDNDLGVRVGLDVVGGNESFLFYTANIGPREEGSAPGPDRRATVRVGFRGPRWRRAPLGRRSSRGTATGPRGRRVTR